MQTPGAFLRRVDYRPVSKLIPLLLFTIQAHADVGMPGPYATQLNSISDEKIQPFFTHQNAEMKCLSTKNNEFLVGIAHQIIIQSSLENVIHTFEYFSAYPEIFESLKQVKLSEKKDPRHFIVEYESIVPIPLVPNTTYLLSYEVKVEPNVNTEHPFKLYRFELLKSNDLKMMDGYAFIQKIGTNETLQEEIDFLDAHWGIAPTLAPGSIWHDTVEETIQTDWALKFRSEDEKISNQEVKKRSIQANSKNKIKECVQNKIPALEFLNQLIKNQTTVEAQKK